MSKAYREVKPGDAILADMWNNMQLDIHKHITEHTHAGGEQGVKLKGLGFDEKAELKVEKLTVKDIDVGQKLLDLQNLKFASAGGSISGALTVDDDSTFKKSLTVEKKLTVNELLTAKKGLTVNGQVTFANNLEVQDSLVVKKTITIEASGIITPVLNVIGSSTISSNLTVNGKLQVGSNYAVTTPGQTVRVVWGCVGSAGNLAAGSGFTVEKYKKVKTDKEGVTGIYLITFNPWFNNIPCVLATQLNPTDSANTKDNAIIIELSSGFCRIKTGSDGGEAADRSFCFIAIGI